MEIIEEILIKIGIINEELGGVQNSMASIQIDVEILKVQMAQVLTYQKIVLGAFLSMVVGIVIFMFRKVFSKVFNNKK